MVTGRRWHQLRPNKDTTRPTRHLFVDVESRLIPRDDGKTEHRLILGWCCYWLRRTDGKADQLTYARFDTIDAFWDLVTTRLKPKDPLYLVAHNVQYDLGVLQGFDRLAARGYEMRSLYLGGMTCILALSHGDRKLCVLDNSNYFPGKLADLGATLGYPKLDVDPLTASTADLDPYCRRDVEIMVKAWQVYYAFLDTHDIGNWAKTIPGQAFNAYRHRFMTHPIYIHANENAIALERAAYHGGRCSVWHQGELRSGPYYKLDVNSMYPYVMANNEYPSALFGVRQSPTLAAVGRWLDTYALVARVVVDTPEPCYPIRQGAHILYPVGRFETALSTPELGYALAHGHLESCSECALYKRAPLFTEYVAFFHALKGQYEAEGNATYRYVSKLYLNSLYGKFGQMHHEWKRVDDPALEALDLDYYVNETTGKRCTLYRVMGETWSCSVAGEAFNAFPAIAAHVTAYARAYLWLLRGAAGAANCFYCDTDSLFVSQDGYAGVLAYVDPNRLGGLKVEAVGDTLTIQAPKVYALGNDWKRKGIRKDALVVAPDTFEQDRFPSFLTQFRWRGGESFHTVRVRRTLSNRIHDGVVDETGHVSPVDAGSLRPDLRIEPDVRERAADIRAQIAALKATAPADNRTVFQMWDHRKGSWKRGRNVLGALVSMEYSEWDSRATELGFADLQALQDAVITTLRIRRRVSQLSHELAGLLKPHAPVETSGPVLF